MTYSSENGTKFNASGSSPSDSSDIADLAARLREERRVSAFMALEYLDPMEAADICVEILEALETDGPRHDPFGRVLSDARLWADSAPPHEIAAYTNAGLERLKSSHLAIRTRKRIFLALWETFDLTDRKAFLAKVDAHVLSGGLK